jgi:hypothetical protein
LPFLSFPYREIAFDQMAHGLAELTRRFTQSVCLVVFLLAAVMGLLEEIPLNSAN